MFNAGTAKVDITPPVGTYIAGSIRRRESHGVMDRLFVHALVLKSGEMKIAMISLDLVGIGKDSSDEACMLIEKQIGIGKENIMISATHTHCGPYSMCIYDADEGDTINEAWLKALPGKIAEAVFLADKNLQVARIGTGRGKVSGVSHHRRLILKDGKVLNSWMKPPEDLVVRAAGPIDTELGVIGVKTKDNDLIGTIINYTCHNATVFGNLFSADYAGVVADIIGKSFGEKAVTLYTAGACGNINTVGTTDEIGKAIAKESEKVLGNIEYKPEVSFRALRKEVQLPLRKFKLDLDEVRRCRGENAVEVFTREVEELKKIKERHIITELQVLVIDDTALVGVPGEYFVEFGLEIKDRSPFAKTFIIELANDFVGYIPTEKSFAEGGYEVLDARSSKLAPEAGRIILDNVMEMLREV